MHGIGPMSVDARQTYRHLQSLLAALDHIQDAYINLSGMGAQGTSNPQAGNKDMHEILNEVRARHASLKMQQQVLPLMQQRLSLTALRQPELAHL